MKRSRSQRQGRRTLNVVGGVMPADDGMYRLTLIPLNTWAQAQNNKKEDKKMKKSNRVLRIGLLALVLTLVTASLVSGTFAKYVTTVNGTGTVQVAHWQVKVGDTAANRTEVTASTLESFNLLNTIEANSDVLQSGNLIAPGTKGSFSIAYDTTGSQVKHQIVIDLEQNTTFPDRLKFYSNPERTTPLVFTSGKSTATLDGGITGISGERTIYWGWDFEETGKNEADTALGRAQGTYTMNVKLVAEQLDTDEYPSGT